MWCPVAAVPHPAAAVPDLEVGLCAADQVSPHGGIVAEVAPKCRTGGSLWYLPLTSRAAVKTSAGDILMFHTFPEKVRANVDSVDQAM